MIRRTISKSTGHPEEVASRFLQIFKEKLERLRMRSVQTDGQAVDFTVGLFRIGGPLDMLNTITRGCVRVRSEEGVVRVTYKLSFLRFIVLMSAVVAFIFGPVAAGFGFSETGVLLGCVVGWCCLVGGNVFIGMLDFSALTGKCLKEAARQVEKGPDLPIAHEADARIGSAKPATTPTSPILKGRRIVAWIGLLVGLWHVGMIYAFPRAAVGGIREVGDLMVTPYVRGIWAAVAGLVAAASLGVLTRRSWGRKSLLLAVILACGGVAAWFAHLPIRAWLKGISDERLIAMAPFGVLVPAIALYLAMLYLREPRVKTESKNRVCP